MRSITLTEATKIYSQEVLDLDKNILLRFYEINNSFAFRFIKYENGQEVDPIKKSEFTWAYGPVSHVQEARNKALEFYLQLIQK